MLKKQFIISSFIFVLINFSSLTTLAQNTSHKASEFHQTALNTYNHNPYVFNKSIISLDSLSKTFEEKRQLFLADIILSLTYLEEGKLDSSLNICYNLFYNEIPLNSEDSIILHLQIGKIYLNLGEVNISKKHIKTALDISKRNNIPTLSITKWMIEIFNQTNEIDSSIYYLKNSLIDNENGKSDTYINLGLQYTKSTQYDSAQFYFDLANELNQINPIKEDFRFTYLGYGNIQYQINNIDSALFYYKKVAIDTSEMSNWYPYVLSNVSIMEIYTEREEYDSSIYYMNQFFLCPCLDYGTKAWLNELKANFYKTINDKENYIKYTSISSVNKDSLIIELEQNINKLSLLNISHLNIIEENVKMKNEKNEAIEQKNSAYFGLIILLFILLIIGVSFYIFRNRKNSQLAIINKELSDSKINELKIIEENLKLEVNNKNRDLSQLATNMVLKREFLVEQKGKLSDLLKLPKDELAKSLKMYLYEFNSFESIDNNLTTIQGNIQEVNSELYTKLKSRFSDLTENDIQICVLHLLKLSTKEISTIKNVTPKAIQVSRYRIKKKMGLGPDDDIIGFIERELLN